LPAAVVPVVVGTAVAHSTVEAIWWRAAAAAVVAVAMQVGANYANDYSDGVRGTDEGRVGPVRLVGQRLASPAAVRTAAVASFAVAGLAGLVLAAAAGWWLLLVGAACMAAGWLYTGGPRPYGYVGLGELFVFVFFGLVATAGSAFVQLERLTALALASAVPVGLLAVALLVTNNLRDVDGDAAASKRTLAVRLGERRTRVLYVALLVAVFAGCLLLVPARPWVVLCLAAVPLAVPLGRTVLAGAAGRDLVPVLVGTGRLQLAVGGLLAVGIAVG
jgi:1,4-dihydroxy-2-naphthoate polyprenyltransferase